MKGTTKKLGLKVLLTAVLQVSAAFAAVVGAAAGPTHPAVAAGAGCVIAQCHGRLLVAATEAKTGSVHQPASAGDCRSCHDLSLAAGERFVKGAPAGHGEGPESAGAWDLALCSGCHGEALVTPDAPAGTTGFVDGKRNLHAHHVQAGRGRRCLSCHDPHAARQPKLLRERIPARGGAQIVQQFRGEPKGGWCKTGCHAPKNYTR